MLNRSSYGSYDVFCKTCFLRQIGPSAFDRVHFIATTNWAGNENEEVWLFLSVVTVIRVLYSSLTRTTLHNKIVHVKVSVKYIRNIASSCLLDVYNSGQTSSFSLPAQFVVAMKCTRSNADGPICRKKQVLLYLCSLLLTLSYAPEPNPGPRPIKFPCAVCNKAVKWSTSGVCWDSCDVWFHQECMGMPDVVYNGLRNISWYCYW
jgi:hypothetical protein